MRRQWNRTLSTWRSVGLGLTAAAVISVVGHAAGANETIAGDLIVEPPTLIALGFEWRISGDDNRNASVAIAYRQQGTPTWKDGLPLHRVQNEHVGNWWPDARYLIKWDAPNLFAGSVFDLEPDTAYDVRLTLSDPDGVTGYPISGDPNRLPNAGAEFRAQPDVRVVTVRTRPEPMPAKDGRVFHVYPWDYTGAKQEPSFKGLKAAYFEGSYCCDLYNNFPVRVQPGDMILMHAGLYRHENRYQYGRNPDRCCENNWDGTYYLTGKGTAERPIVIKAAGDGEVIFDGDGNTFLFNMMGSAYNYFEGVTFRNTEVAIQAGWKDIGGTVGLTVKHSKFLQVGRGIHSDWQGSNNFYIADNEFLGRNQDKGMFRGHPLALSEYAVKLYGSGHVVAYNRVRDFHDGLDHAAFGSPDPKYPLPVSNDFYNNDILNMHDDCFEADGSSYNMRFMRNRCIDASDGFSSQPTFGGPTYVIRNVVYLPGASIAFKTFDAQGWTILNNTFITTQRTAGGNDANSHLRNNLFLAQDPKRPAVDFVTLTAYSSSDYNGFMAGPDAPYAFGLSLPAAGATVQYDQKKLRRVEAKTLEEYRKATGREAHSIMVTFDSVFRNLKPEARTPPFPVHDPQSLDFTLNPAGPAIDAGVVLPNITDGFAGRAPDLGAYELGQPIPHYGPRPQTQQPAGPR